MKIIPLILPLALLLTGCTGTDIRGRISPDVLAVDTAGSVQFAAHDSRGEVITADADSPFLLENALQNASGSRLTTGHLSLLLFSGNPAGILPEYFRRGWITPGCEAVFCPDGACRLLTAEKSPSAQQLRAAVRTGMLPCRTADAVIGDLTGGSGVTAAAAFRGESLTLALFSAEASCGTLSENACRGLALLGRRWESFTFAADGSAFSVRHTLLHLSASQADDRLVFTVSGRIFVQGKADDAAADALTDMLSAALTETARQHGADILMLRETALRDGIAAAKDCTQEMWRETLMQADYRAEPETVFGADS